MPLVTLCGAPLSGKTVFTEALVHEIKSKYPDREVFVINYESLRIDRAQSFKDPTAEKKLNGALRAAVERALTQRKVVILDALNLVKGFRYELFTRAKECLTQHCVVHLPISRETALARNDALGRYPAAVFDDLWGRMEAPIKTDRWDSPLFELPEAAATTGTVVTPAAAASGAGHTGEGKLIDLSASAHDMAASADSGSAAIPPVLCGPELQALVSSVCETMVHSGAVKGHQSTAQVRLERPTFVMELDAVTQDVVRQISEGVRAHVRALALAQTQSETLSSSSSHTASAVQGAAAVAANSGAVAAASAAPTAAPEAVEPPCWLELTINPPSRDFTQGLSAAPAVSSAPSHSAAPAPSAPSAAAAATSASAASSESVASAPAAVKPKRGRLMIKPGQTAAAAASSIKAAPAGPAGGETVRMRLRREVAVQELLAWRAEFAKVASMFPVTTAGGIMKAFCGFLQVKIAAPTGEA